MEPIIDLIPNKIRKISANAFLKLNRQEKQNVESCRFERPVFGSNDFGKFTLTLKTPVFSIHNDEKK